MKYLNGPSSAPIRDCSLSFLLLYRLYVLCWLNHCDLCHRSRVFSRRRLYLDVPNFPVFSRIDFDYTTDNPLSSYCVTVRHDHYVIHSHVSFLYVPFSTGHKQREYISRPSSPKGLYNFLYKLDSSSGISRFFEWALWYLRGCPTQ